MFLSRKSRNPLSQTQEFRVRERCQKIWGQFCAQNEKPSDWPEAWRWPPDAQKIEQLPIYTKFSRNTRKNKTAVTISIPRDDGGDYSIDFVPVDVSLSYSVVVSPDPRSLAETTFYVCSNKPEEETIQANEIYFYKDGEQIKYAYLMFDNEEKYEYHEAIIAASNETLRNCFDLNAKRIEKTERVVINKQDMVPILQELASKGVLSSLITNKGGAEIQNLSKSYPHRLGYVKGEFREKCDKNGGLLTSRVKNIHILPQHGEIKSTRAVYKSEKFQTCSKTRVIEGYSEHQSIWDAVVKSHAYKNFSLVGFFTTGTQRALIQMAIGIGEYHRYLDKIGLYMTDSKPENLTAEPTGDGRYVVYAIDKKSIIAQGLTEDPLSMGVKNFYLTVNEDDGMVIPGKTLRERKKPAHFVPLAYTGAIQHLTDYRVIFLCDAQQKSASFCYLKEGDGGQKERRWYQLYPESEDDWRAVQEEMKQLLVEKHGNQTLVPRLMSLARKQGLPEQGKHLIFTKIDHYFAFHQNLYSLGRLAECKFLIHIGAQESYLLEHTLRDHPDDTPFAEKIADNTIHWLKLAAELGVKPVEECYRNAHPNGNNQKNWGAEVWLWKVLFFEHLFREIKMTNGENRKECIKSILLSVPNLVQQVEDAVSLVKAVEGLVSNSNMAENKTDLKKMDSKIMC